MECNDDVGRITANYKVVVDETITVFGTQCLPTCICWELILGKYMSVRNGWPQDSVIMNTADSETPP